MYPIRQKELECLSKEICTIQKQLLNFPSGHLLCKRNGKYIKWFKTENGKKTPISKKNSSLAQQLVFKRYLSSLLFDLKFEEQLLKSELCQYKNFKSHVSQFMAHPIYPQLLPHAPLNLSEELSMWAKESYSSNTKYQDQLIYHSISGNILRSKSEVFIDQILYRYEIPYRYESLLQFGDFSFYPDFTIRHPQTGNLFYWEHFGMMDNPAYAQSTFQKLSLYNSYGLLSNVNLITTFESKDHPLDVTYVESLVNHFFL